MSQGKHKPEEIVAKHRQLDVLISQGRSVSGALGAISPDYSLGLADMAQTLDRQ